MKSDFTKFRGFSLNKGQNRFHTARFFPFDLLRLSVKVCFGSAIVIFQYQERLAIKDSDVNKIMLSKVKINNFS